MQEIHTYHMQEKKRRERQNRVNHKKKNTEKIYLCIYIYKY